MTVCRQLDIKKVLSSDFYFLFTLTKFRSPGLKCLNLSSQNVKKEKSRVPFNTSEKK